MARRIGGWNDCSCRKVILSTKDVKLPAIHCEASPRIVRTFEELHRLRYENAVQYPEPQYFLDADGKWFQGIVKAYSNRSPWLHRVVCDWDYVDADFKFVALEQSPYTDARWFRYMCVGLWMDKASAKVQRDRFRKLKTTEEIIEWLVDNDHCMVPSH